MNRFFSNISKVLKYFKLQRMEESEYKDYITEEYEERTGKKLTLDPPRSFTEKMQYSKIFLNSPLKTKLADKYAVREWIREEIGEEYLIPLIGVYNRYSDINFDALPEKFVLKTNHSSGWNLVVTDKNKINHFQERLKFNLWMKVNFGYYTDLQLQYTNIEPKIIAEEFIQDSQGKLYDYRFLCFNGKPQFCWVNIEEGKNKYSNIYDLNWNPVTWKFKNLPEAPFEVVQPANFTEMVSIAQDLSQNFSHVRVDLYNLDGTIYFSEMTFTSSAGYRLIEPEEANFEVGKLWDITNHDYYKELQN